MRKETPLWRTVDLLACTSGVVLCATSDSVFWWIFGLVTAVWFAYAYTTTENS